MPVFAYRIDISSDGQTWTPTAYTGRIRTEPDATAAGHTALLRHAVHGSDTLDTRAMVWAAGCPGEDAETAARIRSDWPEGIDADLAPLGRLSDLVAEKKHQAEHHAAQLAESTRDLAHRTAQLERYATSALATANASREAVRTATGRDSAWVSGLLRAHDAAYAPPSAGPSD